MKFALLLLATKASALDVSFTFDPVAGAKGYRMYEQVSADSSRLVKEFQVNTVTADFPAGVHIVWVTAYNDLMETVPSNNVSFTVVKRKLQASDDLGEWRDAVEFTELQSDRRFYRVISD